MDDLSKSYLVLGLKDGASPAEAKQAYRDLVNVWHPDRFGHDERLRLIAQEKLKEINGAYELVKAGFFQASLTPELAAPAEPEVAADVSPDQTPPPTRKRVVLWTLLSVIAFALITTATLLVLQKGRGKTAAASPPTNPAIASTNASSQTTAHALSFNRGHSHVAIATTGSLTGTFTVECWALNRKPKQVGTILSSRAPNDFSFVIKFRQGKRFHGDIGDGSHWLAKMANAPFLYQRDTWYHIAYVVTPTTYCIYINGAPTEANVFPPGNPMLYDANHRLCFGADGLDPDDLDGSITEVRIWKTARSQPQIASNLYKPLTGSEPGLQGYWRFEEGMGTTTADLSGHGFNGTLVGDVSWSANTPPIERR